MTSPFPLCAGKQTKWEWSKSSGMLGWISTSHTNMTYKNQNGNVHGMMPHPWGNRNKSHGKLLVTSPSFCKPTKIQFKLQGGVSPTKNAAASTYLGIVLVDEGAGAGYALAFNPTTKGAESEYELVIPTPGAGPVLLPRCGALVPRVCPRRHDVLVQSQVYCMQRLVLGKGLLPRRW